MTSSPATASPRTTHSDDAIAFVLELGQALHRYGAPAHRLEDALIQVCGTLGIEGRFFSTPTSILAAFGPLVAERTCLVRVEPGDMDLGKLARADQITRKIIKGRMTPDEGHRALRELLLEPPPYGPVVTTLASGLVSASAALFFSGSFHDVIASGALGALAGLFSTRVRQESMGRIRDAVAAGLASLLAVALSRIVDDVSASLVTLSGIVFFLPGLSITTAMNELATRHLASGSARFAGALVSLLGLGFGVGLGTRVGVWLPPRTVAHVDVNWPWPVIACAVVVASLSFLVLFRAGMRDAPAIVAAGALAYTGAQLGAVALGPETGAFLGALAVGLASNLYARVLDRPATVPLVPGILLLVPGSVGFKGVLSMLDRDAVPAVEASFVMVVVAISLVAGLLVANAALPARKAL